MTSFQGSVDNFPSHKRIMIVSIGFLAPILAMVATVFLLITTSWWGYILIMDIVIGIAAVSLSGLLLKDHSVVMNEDEMVYSKGWSKGRIPYRNIVKVYRVLTHGKDAILIVFNDPASRSNPNRCLSIEQIFHRKDRDRIFKDLNIDHEAFKYSIVDRATLDMIRSDRRSIGWVQI